MESKGNGKSQIHYWGWDTQRNIKAMVKDVPRKVALYNSITGDLDRGAGADKYRTVFLEKNLLEASAHNDATAVEYLIRRCGMSPVREIEKKKNVKISPVREAALSDNKGDITEQWAALDRLARAVIDDPHKWAHDCDDIATEEEMAPVKNLVLNVVGGEETALQVINHTDSYGCSILYYCVRKNAHGAVAELLRAGAAVPGVCLHTAVDHGALEAIRLVLPKLRSAETVAADARVRRQSIAIGEDRRRIENRPPAPGMFVVTRLLKWRRSVTSADAAHGAVASKSGNVRRERRRHPEARSMDPHISQQYLECLARHAVKNVSKCKKKTPDNTVAAAAAAETGFDHATARYKRSVQILGAILQYCQPQWRFFRRCLEAYLIEVLCGEVLESCRDDLLDEFVENAIFPLHHALAAARACQKVARTKTLYRELLHSYSLRFEGVVAEIIAECQDADEAEEILYERSDATDAHTTCLALAVVHGNKKITANKLSSAVVQSLWFGRDDTIKEKFQHWDRLSSLPLLRAATALHLGVFVYEVSLLAVLILFMVPISIVPFWKQLRNNLAMNRLQFSCANFKFFSHQFFFTLFIALVCWAEIELTHFFPPEAAASPNRCAGKDKRITMFSTKEKVMYLWVLAIMLRLLELAQMVGWKRFWSFGSNRRESMVVVCFVVSFVLRLAAMSEINAPAADECSVPNVFRASVYATAIAAFASCFRLLDIGAIHHSLGPLWVAVQVMMQDILHFSFLLGVTLLSFVVCFSILIQAHASETGFDSVSSSFFSLLWSLFEPFQGYDPRNSPHIYIIFLLLFLMMALVVLMNLLIAMLNFSSVNVLQHTISDALPPGQLAVGPRVLILALCSAVL